MKKAASILLALLLIMSLFSCSRPGKPEVSATPPEPRAEESEMQGSLKVLSERFCWNCPMSMVNYNNFSPPRDNIANVKFYFQEKYPDVDIEIEYLPTGEDERENAIKQRRVAMMAGDEVPDIYLMPTASQTELSYEPMEPLFKDVTQMMKNNWFADISGLYNGDTELHTEELNKGVMDAGTIGAARYVLPLGYDVPVYITRKDLIDSSGLDRDKLNSGIDGMVEEFLKQNEQGNPKWAGSAYLYDGLPLSFLPKLCDYQKEEALIESKQVSDLLMNLAECNKISIAEWEKRKEAGGKWIYYSFDVDSYIFGNAEFGSDEDNPGARMSLTNVLEATALGKAMGYEMEIIPIRAEDGTLNAEITYWGAISAGCENKKLAYEFLRLFLTPEVQHEEILHGQSQSYDMSFKTAKDSRDGPTPGWPVRYKGVVKGKWDRELRNTENMQGNIKVQRKEAVLGVTMDDSDMPILDVSIDNARFTTWLDSEFLDACIHDIQYTGTLETYSEADATKAANEFLRNVKYHLAEG